MVTRPEERVHLSTDAAGADHMRSRSAFGLFLRSAQISNGYFGKTEVVLVLKAVLA